MLESDGKTNTIPEAFTKMFRKVVQSPSDGKIIHFMDNFTIILMDFGLVHMMTLTMDKIKSGKYHLVHRVICNLLVDRVWKTEALHCIQGTDMLDGLLPRSSENILQ